MRQPGLVAFIPYRYCFQVDYSFNAQRHNILSLITFMGVSSQPSVATSSAASSAAVTLAVDDLPPLALGAERHTLSAESELRLEVSFAKNVGVTVCLQKGSCEVWGAEMALHKPYYLTTPIKIALFTWHGCVVDVECDKSLLEISYISDETNANVSYVNTHAQLEAMRDEAVVAATVAAVAAATAAAVSTTASPTSPSESLEGPRVLICGPPESGKTSLCKILVAYACKVGRCPLWVDLDPADNAISVPGTLSVAPMHRLAVSVESFATTSGPLPPPTATSPSSTINSSSASSTATSTSSNNTSPPLVLWHGSINQLDPQLFRAQVSALAEKIDKRLDHDAEAKSSGIIVNTNGWIQDEGYQLLGHAIAALKITVILIMGHDRLYSLMTNQYKSDTKKKIIKLPRSGGVVSRDGSYLRLCRAKSMKRYFYGDQVLASATTTATSSSSSSQLGGHHHHASRDTPSATLHHRIPQFTPFLLHISFSQLTIYKFSSVALSASLLPVAATQTTETVQLTEITDLTESLQHVLLAVCHPNAVAAFQAQGSASCLVEAGVAGFVAVERVLVDSDMLHLLSPCAGSLPSNVLLTGDITWME
jgi:polyribonucleotide 5'-hydroxyl-kinase